MNAGNHHLGFTKIENKNEYFCERNIAISCNEILVTRSLYLFFKWILIKQYHIALNLLKFDIQKLTYRDLPISHFV